MTARRRLGSASAKAGYVLVKCGKIALVLRMICMYPVAVVAGDQGGFGEFVLLGAVLATSLTVLLAWDRVAPFIARHPATVGLDILLGLVVFASANTPTAYMGYLGTTAVLIGLFFPVLGQILLTMLLSSGYLLVVVIYLLDGSAWAQSPTTVMASLVLFASLTCVGSVMQQLQKQVDAAIEQARSAAADAALGQERSRLARELHDSLVKSLEGISLQAKAMVISGKASAEAHQISQSAREAIAESRQLLTDLRDAAVPPLEDSLQKVVDEVQAVHGVKVDLSIANPMAPLQRDIRYVAQKIAEEALNNAAAHSGEEHVGCEVSHAGGKLHVVVRDAGCGFAARAGKGSRKAHHYGLIGMQERADEVGGKLTVASREGYGAEVTLIVPVADQEEN